MIYILKGKEPVKLIAYRKNKDASYKSFKQSDGKGDVQLALLEEQGYLCAYCMKRIDLDSVRIEHQIPQNPKDESINGKMLGLSYDNMLGVCQGKINLDPKKFNETINPHCEANRGNIVLKVNPKDKHIINTIKYTANGVIQSEDSDIQLDLDKTLRLNIQPLKTNRKFIIEGITEVLNKKSKTIDWSNQIIQKKLTEWQSKHKDTDNKLKFKEYCGAAIYTLKKRLDRAQ